MVEDYDAKRNVAPGGEGGSEGSTTRVRRVLERSRNGSSSVSLDAGRPLYLSDGMRLYRPVWNTYQRLLNRQNWTHRRTLRQFFGRFFGAGDLVFDVGAHRGHYAETFRELGA